MDDQITVENLEPVSEPSKLDKASLAVTLKEWFRADSNHSAEWRTQAKADFGFAVGDQWTAEDRSALEEQKRPAITFNRTLTIIKAVAGMEINGRHDTVYLPRGMAPGAVKANELLTSASQWMSDCSDAEDEQSEAFQDCIVCGMGWTEQRISFDEDPDGSYVEQRIDPLEMYWDRSARSKNLQDARRVFRVRKLTLDEARDFAKSLGAGDVLDDELDAAWAIGAQTDPAKAIEERRLRFENSTGPGDRHEVHIVHAQWIERKPVYRVAAMEQSFEFDETRFAEFEQVARQNGVPYSFVRQTRRVFKQAFLGEGIIGDVMECPAKDRFTFQAITGERDRNRGTWFGFIRLMKDPQMWANKWLSQTLHILNTTAKGGIIAESDAFADQREAQDTYSQPDAITWAAKGAISKGMIMQKPGVGIPTAYVNLLEFAISSIRDSVGVNLELLGMRDANQPGILEAQRKQAGMTILATMFDALRRFRKNVGRVRLHYIQNYLADGRIIRIVGRDGLQQAVPLIRDQTLGDYEVIIEDAPTSPNQKQETWQFIMQLMPVMKGMITPELAAMLLEYSPLPSKLVEGFRQQIEKSQQPGEEQKMQQQIAMQGAVAKIERDKAASQKDMAAADGARAQAMLDLANAAAAGAQADLDRVRAAVVQGMAVPTTRNIADEYVVPPIADPSRTIQPVRPMPMIPNGPRGPELPMGLQQAEPQLPL
jgi:hypothetical protein